jgi:hypothetical protein
MLFEAHRRFLTLTGDTGGRALLSSAVPVDAPAGTLADFDTPELLAAADR